MKYRNNGYPYRDYMSHNGTQRAGAESSKIMTPALHSQRPRDKLIHYVS